MTSETTNSAILKRVTMAFVVVAMTAVLAACGGGSDGGSATPPARTTASVGAEGGTVNGPDGMQVVIPAGALDKPTEIGISNDGSGATEIGGIKPISKVIAVTPHGTEFAESVRISLPFSPADVAAGTQPVIIKSQPGGSWSALKSEVVGSMVSADISGFSYYAVGTCYTSRDVLVPGPDPSIACPSAHSLKLELLNSAGVALPVLRNSNGVAIPVLTITEPAQLKLAFNYSRPPSGRLDRIFTSASGAVTPPGWPRDKPFGGPNDTQLLAGYQTTLTFDANPSTVPNASRPGGTVVRFRASVTTQMDAFYLGCLCFKPARWTYEAEVPVRVIFTAPVTPPPPPVATYTVGGSISGLTGTGLVLRNNGANNLTVAASATTFTFATPVNAGSAYNVTVLSQPAGQTCLVANGAGTTNANVANVAVTCTVAGAKAWQGSGLLETLDGNALDPQIAFSTNGSAVAAWSQISTSGFFDIYVRRYVPATGWGTVEKIQVTDSTTNYSSPQVALDSNGNAIIVFSQNVSEAYPALYTARYAAASASWSASTLITQSVIDPQLAIDSSGNAMVVYTSWNGSYLNILAKRYDAGSSTWQAARILSADIGGSDPRVAFDGSGNAIAIWRKLGSNSTVTQEIMSDRYVAGTGWNPQGLPTTIATFDAGDSRTHRLAVSSNGEAMVVWAQYEVGTTSESIYASRLAGGSWGTPAAVESGTRWAAMPSVAMDANGNAIVSWFEEENSSVSVWARRYTAGVGSDAIRIDDLSMHASGGSLYASGGGPQVAMNATGDAVLVWNQALFTWANRYVAGTGWAGATQIASPASGGSFSSPEVAIDANGNAIAVWPHSGVSGSDIWGNVFR